MITKYLVITEITIEGKRVEIFPYTGGEYEKYIGYQGKLVYETSTLAEAKEKVKDILKEKNTYFTCVTSDGYEIDIYDSELVFNGGK